MSDKTGAGPAGKPSSSAPKPPLGERTGQNLSSGRSAPPPPGPSNIANPNLAPPSDEERQYYFHGLAGGPLIARTNSVQSPWSLPVTGDPYDPDHPGLRLFKKFYAAVGAQRLDTALRVAQLRAVLPHIQEQLDLTGVDWTWFTAVRIGLEKRDFDDLSFDLIEACPLVILVHVTAGSTNFEFGSRVVRAIKGILESHTFMTIHVEMREGHVSEHSVPKELGPAVSRDYFDGTSSTLADLSDTVMPLLPSLGWPVQRTDFESFHKKHPLKPKGAGTVGLYIRCGGQAYGLTAWHCVLPDWDTTDKRITVKDASPDMAVSQADADSYQKVLGRLLEKQADLQTEIADLRSGTSTPTSEDLSKMKRLQNEEKYAETLLAHVRKVSDDFTSSSVESKVKGSGLAKRKIGRIWATPEYTVSASSNPDFKGFWNDWALLDFNPELMENASNEFYIEEDTFRYFLTNRPYDKGIFWTAAIPPMKKKEKQLESDAHRARQCFFKVQSATAKVGRVTDGSHGGLGAIRVVKRGMHGVTLGVTNGVEACIRKKKAGEPTQQKGKGVGGKMPRSAHSWELMVIPFSRNVPFSEPGDSGSSVIDTDGQVVGMVVAGNCDEGKIVPEMNWRGYQAPKSHSWRDPKGFEKGKEPSESALLPHGPLAVGNKWAKEPYPEGMVVSFVTPMEFILEDIKRVTGKETSIM